jgi:hypothetical protein
VVMAISAASIWHVKRQTECTCGKLLYLPLQTHPKHPLGDPSPCRLWLRIAFCVLQRARHWLQEIQHGTVVGVLLGDLESSWMLVQVMSHFELSLRWNCCSDLNHPRAHPLSSRRFEVRQQPLSILGRAQNETADSFPLAGTVDSS